MASQIPQFDEKIAIIKANLRISFWENPDLQSKHPGITGYLNEAQQRIEETLATANLETEAVVLKQIALIWTRYGKALADSYLPVLKAEVQTVVQEFDAKYDDEDAWKEVDPKKMFVDVVGGIVKLLGIWEVKERFAGV